MSVNNKKPKVFFCSNCVYPSSSAVNLDFDSKMICTGCQIVSEKNDIDWKKRKSLLLELIKEYEGKKSTNRGTSSE